MDPRKWLLVSKPPKSDELSELVRHVPTSDYRSPAVVELFLAGMHTGFMLTDMEGQPTLALTTLAKLMNVELCPASYLPIDEQEAFLKGELFEASARRWFLRGFTQKMKAVQSVCALNTWNWWAGWPWRLLPGLESAHIVHLDADRKKRARVRYLASCPPNWEMNNDVYHGLWRWKRDNWGPPSANKWRPAQWPEAYPLLAANHAAGSRGSAGMQDGADGGKGTAAAPGLHAPQGDVEGGAVPRALVAAGG